MIVFTFEITNLKGEKCEYSAFADSELEAKMLIINKYGVSARNEFSLINSFDDRRKLNETVLKTERRAG